MRITIEMWVEIIDDVVQYIPKLINASESIGELLYEPLNDETAPLFGQYLNGLHDFIQVLLMSIEDAKDHAPQIIIEVTAKMNELVVHINTIEQELNNNNYVAVADCMKYEIKALLEELLLVIQETR